MTEEFHKLTIRVPIDIKTWLSANSKLNASSMGSEIVRVLRQRMTSEVMTQPDANR